MNVALVTLARNENKYLGEWFNHYLKLGINHIFIGDNNDEDGESIQEFVDENGWSEFVTVINKRKQKNQTEQLQTQPDFFREMYYTYGGNFDWMCFFDVDEFLDIMPSYLEDYDEINIQNYITHAITVSLSKFQKEPQQLQMGWICFDDNDQLFYDPRPVQERFKRISRVIYYKHQHRNVFCGKCIVKTGLPIEFRDMHIAYIPGGELQTAANGGFTLTTACTMDNFFIHIDAILKHYYSKSTEEFFERRCSTTGYTSISFDRCVKDYFSVNEWTPEKQKLIDILKTKYVK